MKRWHVVLILILWVLVCAALAWFAGTLPTRPR